jgi:hypothetical protein
LNIQIPGPKIRLEYSSGFQAVLSDNSGAYFWYFRDIGVLFTEEMLKKLYLPSVVQHHEYYLLYVGIAEGQSIKERIVDKHLRSAHVSTLRFSIGSLLAHKHNVVPFANAKSGKFAIDEAWEIEGRISGIIEENAMLSWIESKQPGVIERTLLGNYKQVSFPLNIQGNRQHPFCSTLNAIRSKYKRC